MVCCFLFFFKQKTAYEMRISDWSSDVCSSDLIAIIALQLLLRAQLNAEVGHLALAALPMLAGAIFTLVDRGFRTAPDVFTHPAVEFMLGAGALRHVTSPICCFKMPGTAPSE